MGKKDLKNISIRIVEEIQIELRDIEMTCPDVFVKERIHKLLEHIEQETADNETVLQDLIKARIKQTKAVSTELNTNFYMLYRNLVEGRVSAKEAQILYDMYVKEIRTS